MYAHRAGGLDSSFEHPDTSNSSSTRAGGLDVFLVLEQIGGRRSFARDLAMSRSDVADYLGLTIETVCRVLSGFRRDRIIAIPTAHRIEFHHRDALEALCET